MEAAALLMLAAAAATTTIAVIASMFSERARLERALRKTRCIPIAEFPRRGFGKIVGRVEYEDPPVTAPLTRRPCAAYEAVLDVQRDDASWDMVAHETSGAVFRVTDETGCAVVHPDSGRIAVQFDSQTASTPGSPPSPEQQEFLARHGRSREGRWNAFRYREGVVEAGEDVAVCGFGVLEASPKAAPVGDAYRGAPLRLVIRSTRRAPVIISDQRATMKNRSG